MRDASQPIDYYAGDFRDFGLLPIGLAEPPATVRASLLASRAFGQYLFTALVSCLGLGLAALYGLTSPYPWNLVGAVAPLLLVGWLVWYATRNDYRWIELSGDRLTARHLYAVRTVVRTLNEVEDLLTVVLLARTATVALTEKVLGRVRGVQVRFRDGRTPLTIQRTDPAMRNAQELVEAILYRLAERDELDWEIVDFAGRPLVRRVFRKGEATTSGATGEAA
jgi:hypothetical protein